MSDQESVLSFAPLTPPSGMMNHLGPTSYGPSGMASLGERGSCSADSGVRGSSDRESAAGDLNLSDGPCDNGPCITIDSDSISLVSSQMYPCKSLLEKSLKPNIRAIINMVIFSISFRWWNTKRT